MASNSSDNLFDNLSGLGFGDLRSIQLYANNEEPEKKPAGTIRQHTPEDFIFERKVECPVCYKQIGVPCVKTSSIRVLEKDSDFMVHYADPNPSYYDAWVCTYCGYTALSSRFTVLTEKQKKLIRDNITAMWNPDKTYPLLHTVDLAIEKHQLALLNAVVKQGKDSEKAIICLKTAWLYRLKKELIDERKFLDQARQGFIKAVEKESPPIAGLDEPSLEYLIGELYRRLGDSSNALLWFSRVIMNRLTKPRVKELARNQKDLIREQQSIE